MMNYVTTIFYKMQYQRQCGGAMRKIFAVLFVGALILLPCVLRGQDSTTQDDQERQQKIQELQNDIEEQEQEAARWDQTAQDVSGGSDSISNMIGELGAAKARQNAAEARQKAQQDREEIERLMNMPVEHVDIDTSYSGALQQQENQNPTPSIVDTGNQQAEQLRAIGDANAAAQRRAAEERIQAQQQGNNGMDSVGESEICPRMQVWPDMGAHCNAVQSMNQCVRIVSANFTGNASTNNFGMLTVVFANACNQPIRLNAFGAENDSGQLQMIAPGNQFNFSISQHGTQYHYSADDGTDCFVNANRPGCNQ